MGDQQTLRERIKRGDLLLGTFLNMGSPLTAELCGRAGFDWVLIDLEHGAATEADLLAILYAVGQTPATPIVRPPSGERLRIGRALDLGAAGIMVPRIGSVAEVEEAVSYLRYPPDGVRGVALMTRGSKLGDHGHGDVRGLNEGIVGVIQIESRQAVENAAEIAAIEGVDVLFVGPSDLTHNLGIPGELDHPDYRASLELVVAGARAAGKAAGILLRRPEDVEAHAEAGFRFIGVGSDGAFVREGARAVVARARPVAGQV